MTYWQRKGEQMLTPPIGRPHKWPWHLLQPGEPLEVITGEPRKARSAAYGLARLRGWSVSVHVSGGRVVVTRHR